MSAPTNKTKGEPGARWAILRRFTIYKNDAIYLDRLRVVQTPWFGVYLHKIEQPDLDRDPHDHPWRFGSMVLRGGYVEKFHPFPQYERGGVLRTWRRWSWHTMDTATAHRIREVEPRTVTLVLVGRRRRDWGFHTETGFVGWREYLREQAASTTTATGTSRTFPTDVSA